MNIRIFKERAKEEERELIVKLNKDEDGDVCIDAVDKDGGRIFTIAFFGRDGCLVRPFGVRHGYGLKLTERGEIAVR